jgi:hypothetical protein
MKKGEALLAVLAVIGVALLGLDRFYTSRFESKFSEIERQRIITSNKLATAAIVYENLNHVRELVFENMDFPGQKDSISHESVFFEFLTTCINDLKLKLVSIKPVRPVTAGNITTYAYDIDIEGDFFKFGELCAKFENSRRIISLESFDVSLIEGDRPQGRGARFGGQESALYKGLKIRMRVNPFRIKKTVEQPARRGGAQRAVQRPGAVQR